MTGRTPSNAYSAHQVDSSRIIRPDYAAAPYARLASIAQDRWRTDFAPEHYHETGLCLTACGPEQKYVGDSLANVQNIGTDKIQVLDSAPKIASACGLERTVDDACGSTGYVNWSSGWADAEGAMIWLRNEVNKFNRVNFLVASVQKLLFDHTNSSVSGATLTDGSTLRAGLTILAAGAWSASLLDLRGICKSTGQVICYKPISSAEESRLANRPTILNLSNALFMIPPSKGLLKIARHGHGYLNPTTIPHPESADPTDKITVSLPYTHVTDPALVIPAEGRRACADFLASIHPSLAVASRPFTKTRICWYTDTRDGDFLIAHHPKWAGLFVATGGSGHGFKFLPVIGESILECVEGKTPEEFRERWRWPEVRVPEEEWPGDGSRGGPVGMILEEELRKGAARL